MRRSLERSDGLSASRLSKQLSRKLKVSWREQPTRYDIEALHENIRRVGIVIRVRWTLVAVLVAYSLIAGAAYSAVVPTADLARLMVVPALALLVVVGYNTFYSLTYRKFGNFAIFNHVQLLLDAFVVTVLIYYSGGIASWFYAMFPLFVLEAAFILPKRRDAWLVAGYCAGLLGLLVVLEFSHVLPHVVIPFSNVTYRDDLIYVAVRYLWQLAVIFGTAAVATLLVASSAEEIAGCAETICDPTTGLKSRAYFRHVLETETARARRDHRPLHLLLIDLDNFGEFNRRFGIDLGDRLLAQIARALNDIIADTGTVGSATNVVARQGGEEFAVLLVDLDAGTHPPDRDDAMALAWRICRAIASVRVEDAGVTASVGMASLPDEANDAQGLLDIADDALARATEAGGNCAGIGPVVPRDASHGAALDIDDYTEV